MNNKKIVAIAFTLILIPLVFFLLPVSERDIISYVENRKEEKIIKYINENKDQNDNNLLGFSIKKSLNNELDGVKEYLEDRYFLSPQHPLSTLIIDSYNSSNKPFKNTDKMIEKYINDVPNNIESEKINIKFLGDEQLNTDLKKRFEDSIRGYNFALTDKIFEALYKLDIKDQSRFKDLKVSFNKYRSLLSSVHNDSSKLRANVYNYESEIKSKESEIERKKIDIESLMSKLKELNEKFQEYDFIRLNAFIVDVLDDSNRYLYEIALPDYYGYPSTNHAYYLTYERYTTKGRFVSMVENKGKYPSELKNGFTDNWDVYVAVSSQEIIERDALIEEIKETQVKLNETQSDLPSLEYSLESLKSYYQNSKTIYDTNLSSIKLYEDRIIQLEDYKYTESQSDSEFLINCLSLGVCEFTL